MSKCSNRGTSAFSLFVCQSELIVAHATVCVRLQYELEGARCVREGWQLNGDRKGHVHGREPPRGSIGQRAHARPRVSYADNHSGLPEVQPVRKRNAVLLVLGTTKRPGPDLGWDHQTNVRRELYF